MSIPLPLSGPQAHLLLVGKEIVLPTDAKYYSIAPKQNKLQASLDDVEKYLSSLSLSNNDYELAGLEIARLSRVVTGLDAGASSSSTKTAIDAGIRRYDSEASGDPRDGSLSAGSLITHYQWPFLHCLALESCASLPSGASGSGHKRQNSSSTKKQVERKRSRRNQKKNNDNPDKSNSGDGREPGEPGGSSSTQQSPINAEAFDCLLHKRDFERYQCCAKYKIRRWCDLLQHIRRYHLIEREHCPRCRKEYKGEWAEHLKDEHIREDLCQRITVIEAGKLVPEEYGELENLQGSPAQRYERAWDILFPGFPYPGSPYVDSLSTLVANQFDLFQALLPRYLVLEMRQEGFHMEDRFLAALEYHVSRAIQEPSLMLATIGASVEPPVPTIGTTPPLVLTQPLDLSTDLMPESSDEPDLDAQPQEQDLGSSKGTGFHDEYNDADKWINFPGNEVL
ncbi:hypothetical protein F53441_2689 [Fusarium austroafricanum]|uniref:C2H2-type domain-containing protein n=1 Tax=Fusarium austroafricanum TaxID=2364996 RepID=A0A8H4KQT7_9HYPO|nr:hypothetical protein F53441_2689 [Fusarium austroafricanum]